MARTRASKKAARSRARAKSKGKGGGSYQALAEAVRRTPAQIMNEGRMAVAEALDAGVEEMRRVIMTSGTGYVGRGPRATPEGRIDYGHMYDDVTRTSITMKKTGKGLSPTGTFGWMSDPGYYSLQDQGFRNVVGMHALASGRAVALETLRERMR